MIKECEWCGQTLDDGVTHFQETVHNPSNGAWNVVCVEQSCNHEWVTQIVNLEGYIRGNQNPVTRRVCKHCGAVYKWGNP